MYASHEHKIIETKDLFGNYRIIQKGKLLSERAALIKYFWERARNKEGNHFPESFIGYKLSHLSLEDLYAFKSQLCDREKTQQGFNWNKVFWGMLKV